MLLQQRAYVRFYLADGSGSTGTQQPWLRDGVGAAAAAAGAAGWRALAGALSGARYIGQDICYPIVIDPQPEPSGARPLSSGALLIFATSDPAQFATITIPAVRLDLVAANGVELDTAAPAVADLVANIIAGPYCNPFGYEITALVGTVVQVVP